MTAQAAELKQDERSAHNVPTEPIYRLSVAQYHAMIAAGILPGDAPVELLKGWLVQKMGKNPPHSLLTQTLRDLFVRLLPAGYFVNDQEPITLPTSEPELDLSIVRGARPDFATRHPGPADVLLVIEVADSTLLRDRGLKLRIYAAAGIPAYWLFNLVEKQVEVYGAPVGEGESATYAEQTVYSAADTLVVRLEAMEIGEIALSQLLPAEAGSL
jgi:Uma2 family endonuclease